MPSQRTPVAALYRKEEVIGSGSFGVVYKGINVETKQVVAIKILNLDIGDEEVKDVQQEITLLSNLSKSETQNIITYHGAFLSGTKIWIIMDYCSGGSVRTLLKAGRIEEKYAAVIMREMLVALQFIHNQGIIHRDIKAANVLVFRDGRVQLCDFGVAAQLTAAQVKRTSMIGTPFWMAPEVINGSGYNQKADIWSLGITLYEIITGAPPFADQEIKRAVKLIPSTKPTRLEGSQYSASLKEFVALCLDEQPDSRPTAEELLKGRFIKATKSVSYSILKDLIIRYQQWREKNKNIRDSFLIPNGPGASLSDEEDDDFSSFDWDFSPLDSESEHEISNSQNQQQQQQQQQLQQQPFSPSQDFTTHRFSESNFLTSNENCLSQAPTFKGPEDSYISSSNASGMGTTIMTSNGHLSSPNSKVDKHPLLDIFEEEPGKFDFKNSGSHNHSLLNENRNINADNNINDNSAGTSVESYFENRSKDANWNNSIEGQFSTRNTNAVNTDRNIPNISIPSNISTFSPLTNQIEIPSIDDLSSNTKIFSKNPPFLNAPTSSSSTPNLPTHFKTATASSQSSLINSGVSEVSSTTMGYHNSSSNVSASSSAVNITNWNNINSSYNPAKISGRPSVTTNNSSQSRLNQISLTANGLSKPNELLSSQSDSVTVASQYNSYNQAHSLPPVSTVSSASLTSSASEINLNSTYTHQAPPPLTDVSSISRRTPSPKHAIRQASLKATNLPLNISTTSSSNASRIPSQSSQTQSATSKLGTEYLVDEPSEKGVIKNLPKTYIQPSSNAPYYTNTLATSFSTTSLPTMASFPAASYQQSSSGASTPASYDGISLREATLSSPHLKHITQRKLSTSSSSTSVTGKPVSATYKIAQLRGTSGNSATTSASGLQSSSLYSEKSDTHSNTILDEKIKSQNHPQKPVYSQNQSYQNESVDHLPMNKIQLYQQQQQYNQRLQHLQQQQLKASLSTSSVVVPASVSIPQDMFSTVSKTVSTLDDIGKDRETPKNLPNRNSSYNSGESPHEEQGTIRYIDNDKDSRIKTNKEQKTDLSTANNMVSRLRNPSLVNMEDINSYKLSMAVSKIEHEQRKITFPVLRPFNCNIMLDSASKEIVVEEFGHQLDSFISALDAIEHKLLPFSA
ncbi:uncharacterized protein SAPINGB_P006464 [Magnusiomyces paraingens]|uniref:non-specific serine/threonine protein kinase n=1 Tax=Magnusiomyces paraingens TaxID=2606893 RepID=A0A5E8C612_9ASCO|nr:uncharacterized protein SAPINGB_P006464 [Saprochaete ingens]VVT58947.1 unnamed protein product [Saprochaete ingens]